MRELNGPLFEYGAGLSFGGEDSFSFLHTGELEVSRAQQSFTVEIGVSSPVTALPGGTVVQLYFSQAVVQAVRPELMLLGFVKVERSTTNKMTATHITVEILDLGYWHPLPRQTAVDSGSYPSAQLTEVKLHR